MIPPIPALADYGLSATHGFLPAVPPLTRLPDPYYNRWEAIAANLQALILSGRLRGLVDRLPVLSTSGLEHHAEWHRAYSLLTFIANGYIWGGDSPSDRLPAPVAVPLLAVSRRLEVPPVATYAAVCLWNWKPLFANEPIDRLENLATLVTFTGALDESWFFLVSVAMEARGAPMLSVMLAAMAAARREDAPAVTLALIKLAECLDDLTSLLQRMHENCDPTIFYHRVRPFLAGSKHMAEAGLPRGVIYEDGSGSESYRQYAGGSNAQSSLLQFFDLVLGVEHRPTGDKAHADQNKVPHHHQLASSSAKNDFLMEMRRYMPGMHARFLADVQAVADLRGFVGSHREDRTLCVAYDACLSMLRALRDKHIAIVTRYIVLPSREVRARSRSPEARRRPTVNLATASRLQQQEEQQQQQKRHRKPRDSVGIAFDAREAAKVADGGSSGSGLKGTGGTALMSFLKQARDETSEPAVERWTRHFMSRQLRVESTRDGLVDDCFLGKVEQMDQVPVAGLAGTWTLNGEFGGICNY